MNRILPIVMVLLLLFTARASLSVRLQDTAALLDESGGAIIEPGAYKDIVPLGENLFAATVDSKNYALMNSGGEIISDFAYTDFRVNGQIIFACREGLWGLVNLQGEAISDFAYTLLAGDGEFIWAVRGNLADQDSDELFVLHPDGAESATGLFARRFSQSASEGRIAVQPRGSLFWGYCDGEGRLSIPASYSYAGPFTAGRAAVVQDGKYGAIDVNGAWILPARYDFLEISPSGMMLATDRETGIHIFSPDGNENASFPGGETFAALAGEAAAVYAPEKLTLYNAAGEEILSASRRAAVQEGLNGQYILSDGIWGEECVSIAGTENFYQNIYPLGMANERPVYAYMQVNAARYMNDLLDEIQLAMDMENARYGVIDERGEILLEARYQSVQYIADDRLLTQMDGLWQLMDTSGRVYWSHGIMQSEEASF